MFVKPLALLEKMLQRYGSLSGKLHMIELEKSPAAQGLGISLTGNKEDSRARMGVYVADIDPRGPAGVDGRIWVGDELLEINGQILYGRSHQNASTIINNTPSNVTVKLSICRSESLPSASSAQPLPSSSSDPRSAPSLPLPLPQPVVSSTPSSLTYMQTSQTGQSDSQAAGETSSDPLSCPVVAGRETIVEICKGSVGLGLSIVGGSDTLLGAVIVHEVNDGGAAQRDGRLQAGDQILEVNGIDLRQATHDESIAVLRLTTQRVRLCVFRHQETYREEDLWDVFGLELRPRPGEGLGFTTVGKSNDTGIFVSDVIRGGVADSDGRLLLGDQILSINGEDVRAASQEHAQNCSGAVHLEVARFKAGLQYAQRSQGPCDSLGISVAGGVGSPHDNVHLFIATMDTNGLAAESQQLQTGDRILSINGVSTEGMTHVQAGVLLKNATGTISLQVMSLGATRCSLSLVPALLPQQSVVRIRFLTVSCCRSLRFPPSLFTESGERQT
uniref:PDZ domain-containing protein n=1 Tax=Labrus bergylta TaxID=56723 RepID=A0A3Q3H331_9LABR